MARNVRTGSMKAAEFVRILVGQLFDLTEEGVRKKLIRARRAKRTWEHTSAAQRYLVAMFMIGARTQAPAVGSEKLLRILAALRDSGYRALALYHLVKRARPAEVVPFDTPFPWPDILKVIRQVGSDRRAERAPRGRRPRRT
ncbi:unnamed protein product [marine sediment metagenome]|uniref:Uncharacterized protein n=1 Tax=marine sediment metagenome TaxID=412755 RepID=X1IIT7_9ZZZZ